MDVNPRKTQRYLNRTNYFNPAISRTHNSFMSSRSYRFHTIKKEGYESRLYWQYRYCEDNNGQVFYYTLTYADKNIPKFLGHNCFDYEDLRYLLNGGFVKYLLRNYATNLKYFVGAELGDGKGERGFENNPHYHVLFFLTPSDVVIKKKVKDIVCVGQYVKNTKFHKKGEPKYKQVINRVVVPYKKISPVEFRSLIRRYWQGFDEDLDGFYDYRDSKYGICKEGSENLGLVTDFRACMYCAKYCSKDVGLKNFEHVISGILYNKYYEKYRNKETANQCVEDDLRLYRNRYCNKCRISHGVGDYALQFIDDKLNPYIKIPSKDGFKDRPISLYYYRKLFNDVLKDDKGNNVYVLNELGQKFRSSHLLDNIHKNVCYSAPLFEQVLHNRELFDKIIHSDVNDCFTYDYDFLRARYGERLIDKQIFDITYVYSAYKMVYEDRYFKVQRSSSDNSFEFPLLDLQGDYNRFLKPSFRTVDYNPDFTALFIESHSDSWLPYCAHPDFRKYILLFTLFDIITDYFFVQADCKAQEEAERIAAVKRFHDKGKLKSYFSKLV